MRTRVMFTTRGLPLRGGSSMNATPQWLKDNYGWTSQPFVQALDLCAPPGPLVLDATKSDWSKIVDVEHGKGRQNACTHETYKWGNGEYSFITADEVVSMNGNWRFAKGVREGAPVPFSSPYGLLSLTPYEKWQISSRAWREVQPTFDPKSGFSGVNFLLESRELTKLPSQIRRIAKRVKELVFRHDLALYDFTRPLAELQLTADYAVKPLATDFAALTVLAEQSANRLARFNKQGDQWGSRHYAEDLKPSLAEYPYGSATDFRERRGRYHGGLRCRYRQAAEDLGSSLLAYYGLTLSPAQIWEAVPFSFLVDHVITVGKTLEKLSRTAVTKVERGDFVESFTYNTCYLRCMTQTPQLRYFSGTCDARGVNHGIHHPVAWYERQVYERYISLPPALGGVPLPQFRVPSIRNLVDDLALLRTHVGWQKSYDRIKYAIRD